MGISKNPLSSLADVLKVLNETLARPRGVLLKFSTIKALRAYRSKVYSIRAADRAQNIKIYAEGTPLYGKSEYDNIRITSVDEPSPDGTFHLILVDVSQIETPMFDPETKELLKDD